MRKLSDMICSVLRPFRVLLLTVTLGATVIGAQDDDPDQQRVARRQVALPALEPHRKQREKDLMTRIADVDRLCRLNDRQKQALQLAGRGDIKHYMNRLEELRAEMQVGQKDPQRAGDLRGQQQAFEQAVAVQPFSEDSLFVKSLGRNLSRTQMERYEAFAEITRLGGRIKTIPKGTDPEIEVGGTKFGDEHCPRLEAFPEAICLRLARTEVTDAGLVHLKSLRKLETLDLSRTELTDSGLANIKGLDRLQALSLNGTQVTSSGLAQIKSLKGLRQLSLSGTPVDDHGLANLRDMTELRLLDLASTRVTDAGLPHLKNLKNVRYVGLRGTKVTEAGVKELKQALPRSNINR